MRSAPPTPCAGLRALALYFPVSFVLEEVTFRGALDTHLHRLSKRGSAVEVGPEAAGRRTGWSSALFVSALWGLWHLPIVAGSAPLAVTPAQLLLLHCAIGVPLSLGWRRTGNLAVPALAHTLINAVRNALVTGL